MNYDTKQRLLKVLCKHYAMLADDLKYRLLNSDEDVNDIMSDYTVMLNECNELDELLRKESDHEESDYEESDYEESDSDENVKVEPIGITIKFTLAEVQQTSYAVQDAMTKIDGDDYFAQRYRSILQGAERKLHDAVNTALGID